MINVILHWDGQKDLAPFNLAIAQERYHLQTNIPGPQIDGPEVSASLTLCRAPYDYGDSLARLWKKGESFVNLEQDVVPWPGGLSDLWTCPHELCMFPILVHQSMNITNFGCIKFSAVFLQRHKDIWNPPPTDSNRTRLDWRSLDGWFHQKMNEQGVMAHVHYPPAIHWNRNHF